MNAEAGAETDDTPDRAGPGRVDPGQTFKLNQRITSLSVTVALVLVCLKTGAFIASGSIAILASLADSALDLAASLTTFFAVRFAAKPADEDHRFGHGKAEALSSMVQAVLVTLSAIYLVYESVTRLTDPQPIEQGALGIGVMIVSIGMTVGLVWAQTQALKQTASLAVQGDRMHYAADLAANLVVIAGIVFTTVFGLLWADPLVGLLVALWLLNAAREVALHAYDHLMDRELPDAERDAIRRLAADDPRVQGVHQLRTRASGPFIHIQFHMDLDPNLPLAAAHEIVVAAERRIMQAYPAADILIHPDPAGAAESHGNVHFDPQPDE
jgi:cation diffusion facilitator family transporter